MKNHIANAIDPQIFYTARSSKSDFSYNIPLDVYGSYTLVLQFVETTFEAENLR